MEGDEAVARCAPALVALSCALVLSSCTHSSLSPDEVATRYVPVIGSVASVMAQHLEMTPVVEPGEVHTHSTVGRCEAWVRGAWDTPGIPAWDQPLIDEVNRVFRENDFASDEKVSDAGGGHQGLVTTDNQKASLEVLTRSGVEITVTVPVAGTYC
ncbi:hypothetical protein HMPREF1531_01077 [Propionibacterium sp. oral taxon 192 str. F0372]|nr:hypothetical protein HMPREF1531_01077 [Propionibacterium sp. oral taxon 192 str. F0372]